MSLQVEILEQSFVHVRDSASEFTDSFYANLFADSPHLQPLFARTDMAKQRKMLFSALIFVVENLRNPDAFNETLKGLGATHIKHGALPEYYPLFGNALFKTLAQYLGQDWTEEVKQAWSDAYDAISTLMLEGVAG
jgi:hemoglobin-like flavoprotein